MKTDQLSPSETVTSFCIQPVTQDGNDARGYNSIFCRPQNNSAKAGGPKWIGLAQCFVYALAQLAAYLSGIEQGCIVFLLLSTLVGLGIFGMSVSKRPATLPADKPTAQIGLSTRSRLSSAVLGVCLSITGFAVARYSLPRASFQTALRSDDSAFNITDKPGSRGRWSTLELRGEVTEVLPRKGVGELKLLIKASTTPLRKGDLIVVTTSDLPWHRISQVVPGDWVWLTVKARPTVMLPGKIGDLFSYDGYLARRGVSATGKVKLVRAVIKERRYEDSKRGMLVEELRKQFGEREGVSIVLASVLGEGGLLADDISQLFSDTATVHLLVVSGFHIGLVFALIRSLLRRLFSCFEVVVLYLPATVPASVIAFAVCCHYTWLTGAQPPCVRSLIMLAIYLLAELTGRMENTVRSLQVAFVVICTVWPGAFLDAGVQLTFAALAGLLVAGQIARRLPNLQEDHGEYHKSAERSHPVRALSGRNLWHTVVVWVSRSALSSTGASFATAPILLFWFNIFVPLAPLINVIVIPLFSVVVLIGGAISLVSFIVAPRWIDTVVKYQLDLTELLASLLSNLDQLLKACHLGPIYLSRITSWLFGVTLLLCELLLMILVIRRLWLSDPISYDQNITWSK